MLKRFGRLFNGFQRNVTQFNRWNSVDSNGRIPKKDHYLTGFFRLKSLLDYSLVLFMGGGAYLYYRKKKEDELLQITFSVKDLSMDGVEDEKMKHIFSKQKLILNEFVLDENWTKNIKRFSNILPMENDVLVCSFPFSCEEDVIDDVRLMMDIDHNLSEIVSPIETGVRSDKSKENDSKGKVYLSHYPLSIIDEAMISRFKKVIYIVRNPKDIATDYYHHQKYYNDFKEKIEFDEFLQFFLNNLLKFTPWIHHGRTSRIAEKNYHIVIYEEFEKNRLNELKKLKDYLQIKNSDLNAIEKKRSNYKGKRPTKENESLFELLEIGEESYFTQTGNWFNFFKRNYSKKFDKLISEWNEKYEDVGQNRLNCGYSINYLRKIYDIK
ncbi:hypothetical protein SNEBB_007834 [Seison nebaliae]|nr:hypothetical protein SNEBB_007834 [Seison nebaliae]